MKKPNTISLFCTLILALLVFNQASAQNEKDKGKKERQNQSHSKGKPGKDHKGNSEFDKDKEDHLHVKGHKDSRTKDKDVKGEKNTYSVKDISKAGGKDEYRWNHTTFKERSKIKGEKKVTVCHKFEVDGQPGVTLKVSSRALQAHLNHGDMRGECATNATIKHGDNFLGKRTDYYNNVQSTQEQVAYSKSVLAYALGKLSSSRQQLSVMQSNNTPVQAIEQKRVAVVELEQNVSLLERLIGVTANLVANKLQ